MKKFVGAFAFLLLTWLTAFAVVKHPLPGHRYFTIQVASPVKFELAKKIYQKFEGLPFLRIVKADNGHYRVRVGFFSTQKEAQEFIASHERLKKSPHYISLTTYDPSVIIYGFGSNSTSQVLSSTNSSQLANCSITNSNQTIIKSNTISSNVSSNGSTKSLETANTTSFGANATLGKLETNETSRKGSQSFKGIVPETKKLGEKSYSGVEIGENLKQEKTRRHNRNVLNSNKFTSSTDFTFYLYLGILGGAVLLIAAFLLLRGKKQEGVDFEVYIGKLLEEEDYDKIIEVLVPYLKREPEDTFALKALAEAMEKKGRILEAVALYRELAEVLRKKDFVVLAEEFEKKADKLSEKAFNKE